MKKSSLATTIIFGFFAYSAASAVECPCPLGYIEVTRDNNCRCVPGPRMHIFRDAAGLNIKLESLEPSILPSLAESLPAQSNMNVIKLNGDFKVEIDKLGEDSAKEILSKIGKSSSDIPEK